MLQLKVYLLCLAIFQIHLFYCMALSTVTLTAGRHRMPLNIIFDGATQWSYGHTVGEKNNEVMDELYVKGSLDDILVTVKRINDKNVIWERKCVI